MAGSAVPKCLDLPVYKLPPIAKLLVRLSTDQIAIIARDAYLHDILDTTSLREAFRLVAPCLRTEQMPDLSETSLRIHAAQPDQRDLYIAADTLEELAVLIREPPVRYFNTGAMS